MRDLLAYFSTHLRSDDQIFPRRELQRLQRVAVHQHVLGAGVFEYGQAFARALIQADVFFSPDRNLIVCEQDVTPFAEAVDSLLDCTHEWCVQAYLLYPESTGLEYPVYAHRNGKGQEWILSGEQFARYGSLGLAKFGPSAQLMLRFELDRLRRSPWTSLAETVSEILQASYLQVHVHWPEVPHMHGMAEWNRKADAKGVRCP